MEEGYTMVPIKPGTKERLKKEKGIYTFDAEIDKLLILKEKIKKGEKVTSKDLDIQDRRLQE